MATKCFFGNQWKFNFCVFLEKNGPCHLADFNTCFSTMGLDEKSEYQGMKPSDYWSQFGLLDYPRLSQIALRIYQIPTSSAASERVWKVFSFIHSKRRNRLKKDKVKKLAYIYVNAALLDEKDKRDYLLDQADLTGGLSDSESEEEEVLEKDLVVLEE